MSFNWTQKETDINNLNTSDREKYQRLQENKELLNYKEQVKNLKGTIKEKDRKQLIAAKEQEINNIRIQRQEQQMLNKAAQTPKKTYIQLPTSSNKFERQEIGKPKVDVVRGVKGFFKQKETQRLPGTNKLGYSMLGFGSSNEREQIKNNILGFK